ncbi:MAG TPA: hypothetical protein VN030_01325 [Cellvibrio sp.]|nr:hypothetical protein [Cellvibrio sp.]
MFNIRDHFQELRSTIIGLVLLLATTIIGVVWISVGISNCLKAYLGDSWGPIVLGLIYFLPILGYALMKTFGRDTPNEKAIPHSEYNEATALNLSRVFESLPKNASFLVTVAAIAAGFIANRFPAMLPLFTQILSAYAQDIKAKAEQKVAEKFD